MKPIQTDEMESVLKPAAGTEDYVDELPILRHQSGAVSSCWKASWRERLQVLLTGRVWFHTLGRTHPAIMLSTKPDY